MKLYLTSFFLVFSLTIFCQNQKKLNSSLRTELVDLQGSNDSLVSMVHAKTKEIALREESVIQTRNLAEKSRAVLNCNVDFCQKNAANLKNLFGITLDTIISDEIAKKFNKEFPKKRSVLNDSLFQIKINPFQSNLSQIEKEQNLKSENSFLIAHVDSLKKIILFNKNQLHILDSVEQILIAEQHYFEQLNEKSTTLSLLYEQKMNFLGRIGDKNNELKKHIIQNDNKLKPVVYEYGYFILSEERFYQMRVTRIKSDVETNFEDPRIAKPIVKNESNNPIIYNYLDEPAEFPGGNDAFLEYVKNNFKNPSIVNEKNIEGTIHVTFVVSSTGFISNVKIIKGIPSCEPCSAEAIRIIKKMPHWIPGMINGKEVNQYYHISFQIKPNN